MKSSPQPREEKKPVFRERSRSGSGSLALAVRNTIMESIQRGESTPENFKISLGNLIDKLEEQGFEYVGVKQDKKTKLKEAYIAFERYCVSKEETKFSEELMLRPEISRIFVKELENRDWKYKGNKKV